MNGRGGYIREFEFGQVEIYHPSLQSKQPILVCSTPISQKDEKKRTLKLLKSTSYASPKTDTLDTCNIMKYPPSFTVTNVHYAMRNQTNSLIGGEVGDRGEVFIGFCFVLFFFVEI